MKDKDEWEGGREGERGRIGYILSCSYIGNLAIIDA